MAVEILVNGTNRLYVHLAVLFLVIYPMSYAISNNTSCQK